MRKPSGPSGSSPSTKAQKCQVKKRIKYQGLLGFNYLLRNLLIFNLSLSDLWLCLIAMPVTLTEIKVATIIIDWMTFPTVDLLAVGPKPGDSLQDPPSLHFCQVFSIFDHHHHHHCLHQHHHHYYQNPVLN